MKFDELEQFEEFHEFEARVELAFATDFVVSKKAKLKKAKTS